MENVEKFILNFWKILDKKYQRHFQKIFSRFMENFRENFLKIYG